MESCHPVAMFGQLFGQTVCRFLCVDKNNGWFVHQLLKNSQSSENMGREEREMREMTNSFNGKKRLGEEEFEWNFKRVVKK